MNQLKAGQDKGGTGRAYMSAIGQPGDGRRYSANPMQRAADELARILGETEPLADLYWRVQPVHAPRYLSAGVFPCDVARVALAESLAAVTADGGPLDSLAIESAAGTREGWMVLRNLRQHDSIGADPVILAAQRDLAVLSAYAQQGRA